MYVAYVCCDEKRPATRRWWARSCLSCAVHLRDRPGKNRAARGRASATRVLTTGPRSLGQVQQHRLPPASCSRCHSPAAVHRGAPLHWASWGRRQALAHVLCLWGPYGRPASHPAGTILRYKGFTHWRPRGHIGRTPHDRPLVRPWPPPCPPNNNNVLHCTTTLPRQTQAHGELPAPEPSA
jgi:hypothetical protein